MKNPKIEKLFNEIIKFDVSSLKIFNNLDEIQVKDVKLVTE